MIFFGNFFAIFVKLLQLLYERAVPLLESPRRRRK
jgi:hypothetical protein